MLNQIIHIPIVPVHYLHLIKDYPMHMALAHLVNSDKEYCEFYRKKSEEGKYVILDNSVIEMGTACTLDFLLEMAEKINASEIILPDVLENPSKTIISAKKAMMTLKVKKHKFKIAAVCQGKCISDFVECGIALHNLGVDTICIPKLSTKIDPDARAKIAMKLDLAIGGKPIHLLGMWNNLHEIYAIYDEYQPEMQYSQIRSCDTQWAALCTKNRYQVLEVQDTNLTDHPLTRDRFIHKVLNLLIPGYLHPGIFEQNLKQTDEVFDSSFWDYTKTEDDLSLGPAKDNPYLETNNGHKMCCKLNHPEDNILFNPNEIPKFEDEFIPDDEEDLEEFEEPVMEGDDSGEIDKM